MLKLERIYTKPLDMSGYRLFVDRLWCRGISKRDAEIDKWFKDIAPSTKLRKWFKHINVKYPEFKKRYITELKNNPKTSSFLNLIKSKLSAGNVILLYGAKNGLRNNATALRDFLNKDLNLDLKPEYNFKSFLYNDGETNKSKKLLHDAQFLMNHHEVAKKYNLRANEVGKIYHGPSKKILNHLDLMRIVD